jgi:phosphoglycerol transferase MdoB-like AlkP superfamily enzyme
MNLRKVPADSLRRFGFDAEDPQAEMNAFLYTDFTFQTFIETAKKEKYFSNTIFVFIGDHGIRGNATAVLPRVWTDRGLTTQHVPLLFYAPALLQPAVYNKKVSQLDVMPSIAALADLQVKNTTLGKNIFADTSTGSSFVIDPDSRTIGLVGDKYYYEYNLISKSEAFHSLVNNEPLSAGEPSDSVKQSMGNATMAYYETARYMLFNNKKKTKK